jgi:hypothetical protein
MTLERFTEILAAYGASPARWPESERAQALTFAQSDIARPLLAEAQALDALLDTDRRAEDVGEDLVARVLASAPTNVVRFQPRERYRMIAALAACALVGVAIGFGGARGTDDSLAEADAAFGAAFSMDLGG